MATRVRADTMNTLKTALGQLAFVTTDFQVWVWQKTQKFPTILISNPDESYEYTLDGRILTYLKFSLSLVFKGSQSEFNDFIDDVVHTVSTLPNLTVFPRAVTCEKSYEEARDNFEIWLATVEFAVLVGRDL